MTVINRNQKKVQESTQKLTVIVFFEESDNIELDC